MKKWFRIAVVVSTLVTLLLVSPALVASKVGTEALKACKDVAFSTEEDFVTYGPEPPDGNPIISDGDLLGLARDDSGAMRCVVCARNADLLESSFDVSVDIGLDAVDVINVDSYLVAFSTELASPNRGQFTAGDLLLTNGVIIPNQALTYKWSVGYDIGLDAVHFVGPYLDIVRFTEAARQYSRDQYLEAPDRLVGLLAQYEIDLWFSTEGTWTPAAAAGFLDGDLLSARDGVIIAPNSVLLPADVPAGIPVRGVDLGLDAVTSDRGAESRRIHFSTEILHEGELTSFSDGDVLRLGNGVVATNYDLVGCFKPRTRDLGLDALSVTAPAEQPCVSRITRIGGVDIADISSLDGMILPGVVGIAAPMPFGGRIDFQGNICEDVDDFRIVYRKAGSADPWESMKVLASKNWTVAVDDFLPPWPDCNGEQNWASDSDGWFAGPDYLALSDPLYGCNTDLALTVWESTAAVAGPDELYEVVLETDSGGMVVSDTTRLVQLDNTVPEVELDRQPGVCDAFTSADMPLMVTGRMTDTHFYRYRLLITGDGYGVHGYPTVRFYDDATDNVIDTGTVNWDMYVDLHEVDVFDLATNPVKCGYTVWLTGWDRTRVCSFYYGSNVASHCNGCRDSGDAWSFEYTP